MKMASPKEDRPITLADLPKSRKACHRIEVAIEQELAAQGIRLTASRHTLRAALDRMKDVPPSWCELAAWQRMIQSYFGAINIYGNLERWVELRTLKQPRTFTPSQDLDNDDSYMPALVEVETTKQAQRQMFDNDD